MINVNKGMYIEMLIESTINYYLDNGICLIEKRHVPIKILKRNGNLVSAKLINKSYVDFFGIFESKYFSFETKQAESNYFNLSLLKKHQFEHLRIVNKFKGIAFLLVHFFEYDETFFVPFFVIEGWKKMTKQKITINEFNNNEQIIKLDIVFPGILNILDAIKKLAIAS